MTDHIQPIKNEDNIRYMNYMGDPASPDGLDPFKFKDVAPLDAHYIGVSVQTPKIPVPIFFGIAMQDSESGLCDQADQIVQGLIYQVGPLDRNAAAAGLESAAYIHQHVNVLDEAHQQQRGGHHPHIDLLSLPLFSQLAYAIQVTAAEYPMRSGEDSAYSVWQQQLLDIKNGQMSFIQNEARNVTQKAEQENNITMSVSAPDAKSSSPRQGPN